jgi:hypothetical protein
MPYELRVQAENANKTPPKSRVNGNTNPENRKVLPFYELQIYSTVSSHATGWRRRHAVRWGVNNALT